MNGLFVPLLYIICLNLEEYPVLQTSPAILVLADGTVFRGISIGAEGMSSGEVVFNTSMTGYQEILTDPSYCKQIVTLTYPHIGNYGVNAEDVESFKPYVRGFVVSGVSSLDFTLVPSVQVRGKVYDRLSADMQELALTEAEVLAQVLLALKRN